MAKAKADTSAELAVPRYRSHKEVCALKIARVDTSNGDALVFDDARFAPRAMTREFMEKHQPKAGGYWVQYADGYESWSPAEAFESGYTLIEGK
jgi:hypothetical protein